MNHIKHDSEETHLIQEVYEGTVAFAPPRTLASGTREILIDLHTQAIMCTSHPVDKKISVRSDAQSVAGPTLAVPKNELLACPDEEVMTSWQRRITQVDSKGQGYEA